MRKLDVPIIAFDDWPPADRHAWQLALVDGGFFNPGGGLCGYSASRRAALHSAYGRWIGHIRQRGGASVSGLGAADDIVYVATFRDALSSVAPCTSRGYLTDLYTVCRALMPQKDFPLLHAAVRHAWRTARPVGDKFSRMAPARDLFSLGFELMRRAGEMPTALKQAGRFRDGLMIALLMAAPVRLGNFMSMMVGRHLIRSPDQYRVCFDADEVKNRRPLELALPASLTEPINDWLENYRHVCLARRGRWHAGEDVGHLWISDHGSVFRRGSSVRTRIERETERQFGRPINPHLFRDIAATSTALEIPEDIGIVRTILGHSSARSGERFYNQAKSVKASLAHQAALYNLGWMSDSLNAEALCAQ